MRGLTAKIEKPKKRRKNVHSKSKMSKNKNSKNYIKPYAKQGR
jgi:hypothetical protein|tara:strand:- start:550 stop:678 length:129 start_codon:yes stop_codon:yes gene_type:complete